MFFLFALLVGYTRFYTEERERTLNILLKSKIGYFGQRDEGGKISFCTLFVSEKRMLSLLHKYKIGVIKKERCGSIGVFEKYKKRVGIFIGIIIFVTVIFMSERFIWKIDVKGNESIPDTRILSTLRELGVYEGAPSKSINTYETANLCLLREKELSYMSINIIGSCVEIVVKEKSSAQESDKSEIPSSIVAKRSGRITEMEVFSGMALVSVGDTVFAGQTLVSGLYSYDEERYSLVRSRARIYAETVREFSLSVPLKETEKRVDEVREIEKSVIFFTKEIKILKNSRKITPSCDTIENSKRVMLFGRIALPIYIKTVSEISYTEAAVERDKSDALLTARAQMGNILSQYEILSVSTKELVLGDRVCITVTARVNEEIADEIKMIDD